MAKDNPYAVGSLYALHTQPDEMLEWFQKAWKQHDRQLLQTLLTDPFVLPYQHDPRFAALCRQIGLPPPDPNGPAKTNSGAD